MQKLCVADIASLKPGRCAYTSMCKEDGGIFDDFVAFCLAPDHYLITVAAVNVDKTPPWIEQHIQGMDCHMLNMSSGTTCLEIQGPRSRDVLKKLTEADVSNEALPYFSFIQVKVAGIDAIVARLGVTGELGYEVFFPAEWALDVYDAILEAGLDFGMVPCGLDTVRTFRLEKVYSIYGRDLGEFTNPFEAGIGWTVKFNKPDFIGKQALQKVKEEGIKRKLVGFEASITGAAAAGGSDITVDGEKVGQVTVCGYSYTVGKTIGLGYVTVEHSSLGTELQILGSDAHFNASVVQIPFYDPKGARIRM
jgi:aminomethyltransferase